MKSFVLLHKEKSHDELVQDLWELELKSREQKERIVELEALLGKKNALDEHKLFLKADRLAKRALHPKTPGQKVGHAGVTREKPAEIDRIVEQTLKKCPDCNERLTRFSHRI